MPAFADLVETKSDAVYAFTSTRKGPTGALPVTARIFKRSAIDKPSTELPPICRNARRDIP